MRFFPNIRYGTEQYPEKIARRLRAVNISCWLAAIVPACFAIVRFLDPERWEWGIGNALFAIAIATIPLLHRFGPTVAPLVLCAVVYAHLFRLTSLLGTGYGGYVGFLTAAALGMLLIGTERIWLAAALAGAAAGLVILLHAIVPYDTGRLPAATMLGQVSINIVGSTVILFAVVFYALRQAARSEAKAEREQERSESLLVNILPPTIAARLKDRRPVRCGLYLIRRHGRLHGARCRYCA